VKGSLSELLPYNPGHIVCRQHRNHHHHHTTALRLCSSLPRLLSTAAHRPVALNKLSPRMGRDPVLTSTLAQNPHAHIHSSKPLSSLAPQLSTNGYPTHKQSPQPPVAINDRAALMGSVPSSSLTDCQIPHSRLTCEISSESGASCLLASILPTSKSRDVLLESEPSNPISTSKHSIVLQD